jgi:GTP-binding protein
MKIESAKLQKSATLPKDYPNEDLPEIMLVGRSNVGKSSFINSVLGRKNLAYTSSKPGKTQTLNFFLINETFRFVDVPGYGYAKVSKSERDGFATMIDMFLRTREQLELVIMLVDARHAPTKQDVLMLNYLRSYDVPTIIIGTKIDKVPKTKRYAQEKFILKTLNIPEELFIPYSAVEKININLVYDLLEQVMEEYKK